MHAGVAGALLGIYFNDMESQRWWPSLAGRTQTQVEVIPTRPEAIHQDSDFGESKGLGESINSLIGDQPYVGRLGPQDQAPLSRDPIGNGRLADDPALATAFKQGTEGLPAMPASIAGEGGASAPFGPNYEPQKAQPAVVARPPIKAIAVEEKGASVEPVKVAEERIQNSELRTQNSDTELKKVQKTEEKQQETKTNARNEEQRPPGANAVALASGAIAGDPAPMSESESDAFSRGGSIQVRNGRVEARLGRSFKSVKPRLSLKGELDAISMAKPVVEMKVSVDETGKVIDVQVLRSSGSNEIDLPTTTAMYKWWIEPAKNKQGKPMKDVILVTFSYL
jgi:TonB family protein